MHVCNGMRAHIIHAHYLLCNWVISNNVKADAFRLQEVKREVLGQRTNVDTLAHFFSNDNSSSNRYKNMQLNGYNVWGLYSIRHAAVMSSWFYLVHTIGS